MLDKNSVLIFEWWKIILLSNNWFWSFSKFRKILILNILKNFYIME
jgi:hypothetical protein